MDRSGTRTGAGLRRRTVPVVLAVVVFLPIDAHAAGGFTLLANFKSVRVSIDRTTDVDEPLTVRKSSVAALPTGEVALAAEYRGMAPNRAAALGVWNVSFGARSGTKLCAVFSFVAQRYDEMSVFGSAFSTPIFSLARRSLTRVGQLSDGPDAPISFAADSERPGHIDRRCFTASGRGRYVMQAGVAAIAGVRGDFGPLGWGEAVGRYRILRAEVWRCGLSSVAECSRQFQAV